MLPLLRQAEAFVAAQKAPNVIRTAGANRAPGHNQLGASDDWAAVQQFLTEYAGRPATLRTYTKEVERLLIWAALVRERPLSALNRQDFVAYAAFLADPQPRHRWCGPRRGHLGRRYAPGWRPFVGPLSPASQRAAFVILASLFRYLVAAGYLKQSPLAIMRRQAMAADAGLAVERVAARVLDEQQWRAVVASLPPRQAPEDAALRLDGSALAALRVAARERFLVALLYFLALRVSEAASHTMGHFRSLQGQWFFSVVGKGNKPALVPVNDALQEELVAFRTTLALPRTPAVHEATALVPRLGAYHEGVGARRIHQMVKALVSRAALRLVETAPDKAAHLRQASAHWFRHTSLTRQAQAGIPLAELKENARHSRVDTTLLYVHTERAARHDTMQRHGWVQPAPPAAAGTPLSLWQGPAVSPSR